MLKCKYVHCFLYEVEKRNMLQIDFPLPSLCKNELGKTDFKMEFVSSFYLKSVQTTFVLMHFNLWIALGVEGLSVRVSRSCHITKSGDQSGMKS